MNIIPSSLGRGSSVKWVCQCDPALSRLEFFESLLSLWTNRRTYGNSESNSVHSRAAASARLLTDLYMGLHEARAKSRKNKKLHISEVCEVLK